MVNDGSGGTDTSGGVEDLARHEEQRIVAIFEDFQDP